jgi:site-specific DNA-methyltransferase (adenine-specific)
MSKPYQIYNQDCRKLSALPACSVDALVTDPPYGIAYQGHAWDRCLPEAVIWQECLRVMKEGSYGLVFSSVRLMHRLMVHLEDTGFIIKDVLFWVHVNGMPKNRNIALDIDESLGVESEVVGHYKYVQGYAKGGADSYTAKSHKPIREPASDLGKKYKGAGVNLKPAYEPIILVQKPMKAGNVAENIIKHGTGALNLEETRIPYAVDEGKVGHNPHPVGRVASNILRTVDLQDGYDKFFAVPKVRQHAEEFNHHPTLKPVALMHHLVKLITFEGQTVLDPFMGSGSTGVACLECHRDFLGYELSAEYFAIAERRLQHVLQHAEDAPDLFNPAFGAELRV